MCIPRAGAKVGNTEFRWTGVRVPLGRGWKHMSRRTLGAHRVKPRGDLRRVRRGWKHKRLLDDRVALGGTEIQPVITRMTAAGPNPASNLQTPEREQTAERRSEGWQVRKGCRRFSLGHPDLSLPPPYRVLPGFRLARNPGLSPERGSRPAPESARCRQQPELLTGGRWRSRERGNPSVA